MALGFGPLSDKAISDTALGRIFVELGHGGVICGGLANVDASNERQVGAAIVFYHTGATYEGQFQLEQSLSLGGHRSGSISPRCGVLEAQAVPNVDILDASHQIGRGNLTVLGASLLYTGPGATVGDPVQPILGIPVTVEDSLNQWVVVQQTTNAPLQGSGSAEFHEQLNNVWGASNGTTAGETTYRGVILRNNALDNVTSITLSVNTLASTSCLQPIIGTGAGKLWGQDFTSFPWQGWISLTSGEAMYYSSRGDQYLNVPAAGRGVLGTSAQAGSWTDTITAIPPIMLALETPSSGAIQGPLANETTSPSGLTFVNSVTISSLTPWQEMGLWVQRQLPSGMTAAPWFENDISLQFTLDGVTYNDSLVGAFRVSNSALARYEVSYAVGQPPDLTQPANETFSSLPYTTTGTFAANENVYLSTNLRNVENLVSENTDFYVLSIGSGGTQQNLPPSAPTTTLDAVGTEFQIQSYYFDLSDQNPADQFAIYISFNTDDPLSQTPIMVDVRDLGPYDYLNYVTASQTMGTTAYVCVKMYRSSDGVYSQNSNVLSVTSQVTDFGPAQLKGFARYIFEQRN
ncbi:MAG TPA: hypothetical protein VFG04_14105 [Planctomycetaceae bacterium]|jgi:hypothetical protein|nr:hypothetical protein [Planctomycetaceae bacterium]